MPYRYLVAAALAALLAPHAPAADVKKKPNVLFIAVDDLNHWVGHLGRNKQTKTPNIDALASRGVTFTRAYATAASCNPSRASILCGLRPSTSAVYHNDEDPWPRVGKVVTLQEMFRAAGYFAAASGKIYHGAYEPKGKWDSFLMSKAGKKDGGEGGVGGIRFAPIKGGDADVPDYAITDAIIKELGKKHDKPFFLALGLHKPHMPWNVPKKYYDLFPLDKIELPPHKADDLDDVPAAGKKMANPKGDHAAVVKAGKWKEAVQGYLAAIAYTDMNVGRVLDALDSSAYKDDTIVVLWGDHGWHLGEKSHWRKFSLWEEATRVPLVWVVPGVTRPGDVCGRTVDLQCLYPTLADLCGLTPPRHVEGGSIRALLADPRAAWDRPALTTHGYRNHAVRTERWRYIRYADGGEELYDHDKDPYEWTNLADRREMAKVKQEMAKHLPKTDREPVK